MTTTTNEAADRLRADLPDPPDRVMVTVQLTELEAEQIDRALLEYVPDANLRENGWTGREIAALDRAYDKLSRARAETTE